ncbi:MAG: phosphoadenylyl-sulfate reductase [Bacteroidetes bacterium]|nr:phosphoadenylyl-sulfate reductase [Bacteroidota bacterium]
MTLSPEKFQPAHYAKTAEWQDISVGLLNDVFAPLSFQERIRLLYKYFRPDDVLFTSSFGTNSVFLLYWVQEIRPSQPVHFIDTMYHFPETLAYKDDLIRRYHLNVVDVLPEPEQNARTREEQWWVDHPRMCCSINKVVPLEAIKARHKVWISGLMSFQTESRSNLHVFERQGDILKFHPLIDLDEGELLYYFSLHNLPRHPLEEQGYGSIGCRHCTQKGEGREGRWKGQARTECGLHPGCFIKKNGTSGH